MYVISTAATILTVSCQLPPGHESRKIAPCGPPGFAMPLLDSDAADRAPSIAAAGWVRQLPPDYSRGIRLTKHSSRRTTPSMLPYYSPPVAGSAAPCANERAGRATLNRATPAEGAADAVLSGPAAVESSDLR